MKRYTVVWSSLAQDQLTELWLAASDRQWITVSADFIERMLSHDPYRGSGHISDELIRLTVAPLEVAFTISDDDRLVTVKGVKVIPP